MQADELWTGPFRALAPSIQMRGARIELSGQITREIKRQNNETFHQLIQRPDLVDIHIRAQREYDGLSDEEKLTRVAWPFTWITQTEDGWRARKHGAPDMEWVGRYAQGAALVLRSEGGQIVWPGLRGFFETPFSDALERTVREGDARCLDLLLG